MGEPHCAGYQHDYRQDMRTWLHVALWLALLVHSTVAKPPCPAQLPCQCTDLRMKCLQQDKMHLYYLSHIPYIGPSNYDTRWTYSFHEIRIRNQALTNLTLHFPWGILNVKKIEVTSSLVRRIMPGAFKGLMGILSLNLSHNLLSSLGPSDLADVPLLKELILHNNLITSVHPAVFYHTAFIAKLYLSHNLLQEVPRDIRQLNSLTHLYLQYNNISVIRNYAFDGLRRLIILDLGSLGSNLWIQDLAFCGVSAPIADSGSPPEMPDTGAHASHQPGLVALYLRENVLRDLNLCALGKIHSLRGLNISGSLIPCSCEALSLLNRTQWQTVYGFSPRYVTFESLQIGSCNPQLCQGWKPELGCARTCVPQPAFQSPRMLQGEASADWSQFGVRLSVRAEDGSEAPTNHGNSAGASQRLQPRRWYFLAAIVYMMASATIGFAVM